MKCPFVVRVVKRVEPKYDEAGNKIGEDIVEEVERADCIKGDCLLFATDKNQCSFVTVQETISALDGLAARSVDNILTRYERIIKERIELVDNNLKNSLSNFTEEIKKNNDLIYNLQKTGFEKLISFVSGGYDSTKAINQQLIEFKTALDEMVKEQARVQDSTAQRINDPMQEVVNRLTGNIQEVLNRAQQSREELARNITALTERMSEDFKTGLDGVKDKVGSEMGRLVEIENQTREGITKMGEGLNQLVEADTQSREKIDKAYADLIQGINNIPDRLNQDLSNNINELKTKIGEEFTRFIEVETQQREKMIGALDDLGRGLDGLKGEFNQYLQKQEEGLNQLMATEKSYREDASRRLEETLGGFNQSLENAIDGMKGDISGQIEKIGEFGKNYQVWIDSAVSGFKEGIDAAINTMKEEIGGQVAKIGDFEKSHQQWMEDMLKEVKGFFEAEQAFLKEERARRKVEEADRLNEMAILDFHRGNYESALGSVKKALDLNEKAEFFANLGMIHTELNNAEEAQQAFEQSLKLNPDSAEIYNNLGVLNYRIKNFEQAVNAFNEAIKRRGNYPIAYIHLGKALLELERYDDAIKTWEKVLEIDPENTEAQNMIKMYKEGRIDGHTEEA